MSRSLASSACGGAGRYVRVSRYESQPIGNSRINIPTSQLPSPQGVYSIFYSLGYIRLHVCRVEREERDSLLDEYVSGRDIELASLECFSVGD